MEIPKLTTRIVMYIRIYKYCVYMIKKLVTIYRKVAVIKHQWRCKSTPFWLMKSIKSNFLLLMYEHLFIFRKPMKDERLNKYKESMDWS